MNKEEGEEVEEEGGIDKEGEGEGEEEEQNAEEDCGENLSLNILAKYLG